MSETTASFKAGDVVETTFGVGVIVERRPQNVFVVRLWRLPGKSVATAALAYLQSDAILQELPVAPGMFTSIKEETKDGENKSTKVLVHAYMNDRKAYLVSDVEQSPTDEQDKSKSEDPLLPAEATTLVRNTGASLRNSLSATTVASMTASDLKEIPVTALEKSPSSKFYPVLEALMRRGDETAAAARQFWEANQATQTVVQKTGKAILQNSKETLASSSSSSPPPLEQHVAPTVQAAKGKINELADQAEQAAPVVEEQFRQILTIVKDEEITTLLENAKSRLEQLVATDLSTAAREALQKQGIRIQLDSDDDDDADDEDNDEPKGEATGETSTKRKISVSLNKSRQAALKSIQRILQQADLDTSDLEAVRGELTQNFTTAFDQLATAARSDRNLHRLFDTIAEKTTVWQEATGRLLQTKSASLFLEGATRLQARAAAIFLVHQRTGSEIGSKMTKAFTEGDAAIARIKSIQLGDALKDRLVRAIEVRSDSMGGLDAIIAGALTSVRRQDDGDKIQNMLRGRDSQTLRTYCSTCLAAD
eukprot:scaffold3782_cov170-Amphora_coffeaeformis.AAC.6